jgi:hypothetical protein
MLCQIKIQKKQIIANLEAEYMQDYTSLVNAMVEKSVKLESGVVDFLQKKIDEMFVQQTNKILLSMGEALRKEVSSLVEQIYSLGVKDQRIIIRGKEQNIALSLYNCQTLLNAEGNIIHAARLAANQFSDDFRKVSLVEGVQDIPINEAEFMNRYAVFDGLSGWYSGKVTFQEARNENYGPYVGATVSEAFVSMPDTWSFTHTLGCTNYLEGYYLSLFNACADLISVVANAQGKAHDRKFAISVENTKERVIGKTFYHIYYTENYLKEWKEIDSAIYYLIDQLNNPGIDRTDIFEMVQAIKDIRQLIMNYFPNHPENDIFYIVVSVINREKLLTILKTIEDNPEQIESNRYALHCLLNDLRVKYEDLRIAKLSQK